MDEQRGLMSRRSQCLCPVLVLACVGITLLHEASPQPKPVLEGHKKDPSGSLGFSPAFFQWPFVGYSEDALWAECLLL